MYINKTLLSIAFLFSSLTLFSQRTIPEFSYEVRQPYIDVTGTATKEIAPDEIYVLISLIEKTNEKGSSIQSQEERIRAILNGLKLDISNIKLSDTRSEMMMVDNKEAGIKTTKDYVLKLSTANEVSEVFGRLSNANIKVFKILRITHSKIDEYRKEVKIAALKAAKEKAEFLLNAVGEKPGRALEINEVSDYNYPWIRNSSNMQAFTPNAYANSSVSISEEGNFTSGSNFREIVLRSTFQVRYAIAQ